MHNDNLKKIKALEEKVRLLEIENRDWTDRAEDVFLFASISEVIHKLNSENEIFEAVLEKIAVMKELPYCAMGILNGNKIDILTEYADFSNETNIIKISISDRLVDYLNQGNILIDYLKEYREDIKISYSFNSFLPQSYLIFKTSNLKKGDILFIALDGNTPGYLKSIKATIEHVVMLTNSKLDNIYLMEQLENQNKLLEEKVAKRTKDLLESEEKYRKLIEQSNDAIYLMVNEAFEFINPKFTEIFGYTDKDIISTNFNIMNLIHEKSLPKIQKRISDLKEGKKVSEIYDFKAVTKNGSVVDCEVSASYIDYNNQVAVQGVIRDITEKNKMIDQLIIAKEDAEKADRLKSEFLAQVSHEIRTPINTLLSFASLIKEKLQNINDEEINDSIQYMSSAGRRIIRTIDLIINMSEIKSGTIDYYPKVVDLYEDILGDLILEYKPIAYEKNINMNAYIKTNNTKIKIDEYSVSQIFHNLIDNAVKFTNKGNIFIKINRDKNQNLYVSIEDTGIGIDEEYLPNIFQAFTQEEQGYTRSFEGNGLGLAIVKKYCNINNASIEVNSKKGIGTTFKVTFNEHSVI